MTNNGVISMPTELNSNATPLPADLSDNATRKELTPVAVKAVCRIADAWGLNAFQTSQLLGVNKRTWYRLRDNPAKPLSQDTLTRISALVGIYKGLRLLFSEPLVSTWPSRANENPLFSKNTPVDSMIKGGIPTMLRVRGYIDALRGGI